MTALLQKFMLLNPMSMLRDILGADVTRKLCWCLVLVALILVVVLFSPVIGEGVSMFSAAESLPKPANYVAMSLIGSIFLCLCCCCCVLIRRCVTFVRTKCSVGCKYCRSCFPCCNRKKRQRFRSRTQSAKGRQILEMKSR